MKTLYWLVAIPLHNRVRNNDRYSLITSKQKPCGVTVYGALGKTFRKKAPANFLRISITLVWGDVNDMD